MLPKLYPKQKKEEQKITALKKTSAPWATCISIGIGPAFSANKPKNKIATLRIVQKKH